MVGANPLESVLEKKPKRIFEELVKTDMNNLLHTS